MDKNEILRIAVNKLANHVDMLERNRRTQDDLVKKMWIMITQMKPELAGQIARMSRFQAELASLRAEKEPCADFRLALEDPRRSDLHRRGILSRDRTERHAEEVERLAMLLNTKVPGANPTVRAPAKVTVGDLKVATPPKKSAKQKARQKARRKARRNQG